MPTIAPTHEPLRQNRRLERIAVGALLLFVVIRGALSIVVLPPFAGFDEVYHVDYVEHLLRESKLPVYGETTFLSYDPKPKSLAFSERFHGVYNPEAIQPPFSYVLGAAILTPFRSAAVSDHVRILRTLSLVFAVGTVAAGVAFARIVFGRPWPAIAAGALIALTPTFHLTTVTVTNDAALYFFVALTLFLLARAVTRERLRTIDGVSLGLVVGLGLLSKASFWLLVPFVIFVGGWIVYRDRRTWKFFLFLLASAVAVSLWWFIRSVAVYGDWLGLDTLRNASVYRAQPFSAVASLPVLIFWPEYWLATWKSFLGFIAWDSTIGDVYVLRGEDLLLFGLLAVNVIAVTASVVIALRRFLARLAGVRERMFLGSGLLVIGSLAASFVYTYVWDFQPAGRYLLPVLPAIALLAVEGYRRLMYPGWLRFAAVLGISALFVFDVVAFRSVVHLLS